MYISLLTCLIFVFKIIQKKIQAGRGSYKSALRQENAGRKAADVAGAEPENGGWQDVKSQRWKAP